MKPASAKAKGRILQQLLCKTLLSRFIELEPDDITSRSMGANGTDVLLSPAAKRLIPFDFECKNIAAFVGYNFLSQAEANTGKGRKPCAVVKANHKRPVVIMYLDDFMELL